MKVSELLDDIKNHDLVLPEFQREYVWTRDQSKQLIVSLIKGYPVGSLLFWKTDQPPDLKNLSKIPDKFGTIKVILDGQQRLTTLFLLIEGAIPAYYTLSDIETDPRDLYFSIETGDVQYFQPLRMQDNPLWRRVVDCFVTENSEQDVNVFEIAEAISRNTAQPALQLAQLYSKNLQLLRSIKAVDIPVQTVPPRASIDEAIDIFDRVNSQGTKLTDAELALTHVTGKWPKARREMKGKIAELATRNYYFDLTFMTRALTGVVAQRALFQSLHNQSYEASVAGWERLGKILDYLVTLLPDQACVHSTEDLNATNVLIPLIVYLSRHDCKFQDRASMMQAIHWLYAAHTWARYGSQTDQRLDHDVSLVLRDAEPWSGLRDQIIDQRGRITVTGTDMEGHGIQHPLFRMTYILSKKLGAVDWFNGATLGTTHGKAYRIHNHHIFPQSLLYANGYDPDNHLHRKVVNEIANRAVLTADSNITLSNTPPEDYLPEIERRFPGALAAQFIPMDRELWRVSRYADFLEARRRIIAHNLNDFMNALITEPASPNASTAADLIALGESATLEFKSTLRWDVRLNQVNKELPFSVLKTIAAFLNSNGGTLIIGVEDNGSIFGLEHDLAALSKQSLDVFEQTLVNLICSHVGAQFAPLVKIRFDKVEGQSVCVVDVDNAPQPAYVNGPRGLEFYVRTGNTTRSFNTQEATEYIQMHWD